MLHSHEPEALLFSSMAACQLASVPTLKEPLGVAGTIEALAEVIRRCGG